VDISVCLAAYNGSRFIQPQVVSILGQLGDNDELIIVDDCSQDDTFEVVAQIGDPRIVLVRNERNLGVNGAFERAIAQAKREVIFLCDQDDIWIDGRKAYMLAPFSAPRVNVVASNYSLIDENGRPLLGSLATSLVVEDDKRIARNIVRIFLGKMNYYGCAMAFRADFRRKILPFPAGLECHDIWVALMGNLERSITHLPKPTLLHRIHGGNASILRRTLLSRITARVQLLYQLVLAASRLGC
jgi:glycosyltransferase involved in cell wall biosynthesis